MSARQKLADAVRRNQSQLVVGLDPDPKRLGNADVVAFCSAIIDATKDLVCAYKPNFAFFEQLGVDGLRALDAVRRTIPDDVLTIADAKRGDIGSTAEAYARAIYASFGFDAVTVSPYLGRDSLEPFLADPTKLVFVLCRTSNPGATDLQDLVVTMPTGDAMPLYQAVAARCHDWNDRGNVGLVVGATYPIELGAVRRICPDQPILVPGVGAQGGDLEAACAAGRAADPSLLLISVSRQVIFAGTGPGWGTAARAAATTLRAAISTAWTGATPAI